MKRLTALLLTIALILLTAGCSGLGFIKRRNYKIAFVTGPQSIYAEDFAEVKSIADKNGKAILVKYLEDDFYKNKKSVDKAVSPFLTDNKVKALIFTQGFEGVTETLSTVKELRPDIFCIVINPCEDIEALSKIADMVFTVDEDAYGTALVKYVKQAGAEVLVSYKDSRLMQYPNVLRRLNAISKACGEAGIKLDLADDVDYRAGYGIDGARMFIYEDIPRKLSKHSDKKLAIMTNEYAVSGAVVSAACDNGLIFPVQPDASPLVGYPEAFGVDIEGNETDYERAYNKITDAAGKRERPVTGQICAVSVPIMMIKTAFDYVDMYCSGDTVGKLDPAALQKLADDFSGESNNLGRYVNDKDVTLNNCILFGINAVNL